jgi:hypothetical protein
MKRVLFSILLLSGALFLFTANSGGAGAAQRIDRTGSPLGSGSCSNCHTGGNFGTEVSVRLLQNGETIEAYVPGEEYELEIGISTNGGAERYGFMAVALAGEDNSSAGTFGTPPEATQITTLNNRNYFEHANKLETDTITIAWTAPAEGTGTVRIYAAGNAVNNASGSLGDDADKLDEPVEIQESTVSSIASLDRLGVDWMVFPNPAIDRIQAQVRLQERAVFQLRLTDIQNRTLQSQSVSLGAGTHTLESNLSNLSPGLYFWQLISPEGISTRKFVKR